MTESLPKSQVNIKENPPESKDLDVNQYERKST
jgi:hypothetical protein